MIKLLFLSLIATLLVAQNPKAYSSIGDPVYDNAKYILDLKHLEEYEMYEVKIDNYFFDVDELKDVGFKIDKTKNSYKKEYLTSLRVLSKTNNFFTNLVNKAFHKSIENEDTLSFINTVNSGLVDTDKYKNVIIDFYKKHPDDIKNVKVIDDFLVENERLRFEREERLRILRESMPSKQSLKEAKLKRIKENDKRKQELREKELQRELKQKKLEIRQNQKRELSY